MAYYNGFPANYQPLYQAPQYQAPVMQTPQQYQAPAVQAPQQSQQTGNSSMIWVQGEQAAKSYLVAPNSSVVLFDSEDKIIYLKSADASGMPSMKILEYTIRGDTGSAAAAPASEYATKDEVNALAAKIREMKDELAGISKRRNRLMKEEDDE